LHNSPRHIHLGYTFASARHDRNSKGMAIDTVEAVEKNAELLFYPSSSPAPTVMPMMPVSKSIHNIWRKHWGCDYAQRLSCKIKHLNWTQHVQGTDTWELIQIHHAGKQGLRFQDGRIPLGLFPLFHCAGFGYQQVVSGSIISTIASSNRSGTITTIVSVRRHSRPDVTWSSICRVDAAG
jgi:hypothetical protein